MKKTFCMLLTAVMVLILTAGAIAEKAWVICDPQSYVNVRMYPNKKSMIAGSMECGTEIETDGQTKNGWLHIINAHLESDDGWIRKWYVTYEKPEIEEPRIYVVVAKKRVAARRGVNGKFRRWLKNGEQVKVYCMSDWAVTSKGYVKSEYLEVGVDD